MASLPVARGNYKHYTIEQKQAAVQLASERSCAHASRQLKIPESTIRTWKKKLATGGFNDGKANIGLALSYPQEVDIQIRDWVLLMRSRNLPVSRLALCEYARRRPDFKASDGWLRHFLPRHHLSLRTKTTQCQQLPEDLEKRIKVFETYLRQQRLNDDFDEECIINMDETSSFFDMVPTKTINRKGKKSVIVRTTGSEKRHCTVVLSVTSAGGTLPPLIIYKGKRWPSDVQAVPEGLHLHMQEKGWMDEIAMHYWIDNVLVPFTKGRKSLLIMDSFAAHINPPIRKKLEETNVTIAIIPGGCTPKIQPLDVSINKPFKDHLRQAWTTYMSESDYTQSKIPPPTRQHMLNWVQESWTKIGQNPQMIRKSFDASGITGPLEEAAAEVARRRAVLESALLSDDSSDSDFLGFTEEVELDDDSQNPFL